MLGLKPKPGFQLRRKYNKRIHSNPYFIVKTAMTLAQAQAQAQAQKIFLFSLACAYASFALLQVKTKYCSGITQAQGYLPHVVMFGQ